ncbi:MAG TPA: fatty acid--CoA ligase family protein [Verrucomicrobiales bacterium]|nr:fatty acid--CoA ligase family protein [Verrucomicrobiales bacterium]
MTILYQRWLALCNQRSSELALVDLTQQRQWTFGEIQARLRRIPKVTGLVAPQGFSVETVFATLRAWRDGLILCPLEDQNQTAPPAAFLQQLPEGICHLKRTSGSTGNPRWIMFKPEQLMADVDQIVGSMGLDPSRPNLGTISMAHSYGFSSLVLPLLLHGIPLVWAGGFLPEPVADALQSEFAPFTLPAVPAMWRAWAAAGILGSGIGLAISAGAPLGLELERDIHQRFGLKVHNFYGSSECGGIAYDASDLPRSDGAFVGTALEGVELCPSPEGCLEVRSLAVATGYGSSNAQEIGPRLQDGVFTTSDLVEFLPGAEGIRILGRLDDLINVAGRKISPASLELCLHAFPFVRCCLVFGVPSPDPARGDDIVACINPGEHEEGPLIDTLRNEISKRFPPFAMPRHWWICQELTPDTRGKLSRAFWRTKYLNHRPPS